MPKRSYERYPTSQVIKTGLVNSTDFGYDLNRKNLTEEYQKVLKSHEKKFNV